MTNSALLARPYAVPRKQKVLTVNKAENSKTFPVIRDVSPATSECVFILLRRQLKKSRLNTNVQSTLCVATSGHWVHLHRLSMGWPGCRPAKRRTSQLPGTTVIYYPSLSLIIFHPNSCFLACLSAMRF